MYLSAISVGYAVPRNDFNATVHSVFNYAVNLQPENDSRLLTLFTNSKADLPQGIRINSPKTFSFEEMHTGEIITCRGSRLHFAGSSLTIDMHSARSWKCNLPSLMADITNPAIATTWRIVCQVLGKQQGCLRFKITTENPIFSNKIVLLGMLRTIDKAIRDLVDATRRYDLTSTRALEILIGLGTGLTPSCDDFLVGYLAGLWCTVQGRSERIQFVSDLGKEVIQLSSRTNDISRTYLYHAICGQVSSLLLSLAKSICQEGNSDDLIGIAEAAMRVGHTSGMAAVAGLLLGLAVWDGDYLLKDIDKKGSLFSLLRTIL